MTEKPLDECYRCEHYRGERIGPGGCCRCLVLDVMSECECECHSFVPKEPPHIGHEWKNLTPSERADVERWVRQKGWAL